MKKLMILTAAFLFAVQISKAQTERGDQTLGINLGYNYNKIGGVTTNTYDNSSSTQSTKQSDFDIGPMYSYFIADKLDIGANLALSSDSYNYGTNSSPTNQSSTTFGGSVFIRKYIMCAGKIGFRVGPYVGYTYGTEKINYPAIYNIDNANSKSNNYNAGINLDLVYYPAKHLGLSASLANLQYLHSKTTDPLQGHESSDEVNADFITNGLTMSMFYVFGGK